MKSADKKQDFLNAIKATGKTEITKSELKDVANSIGMNPQSLGWFTKQPENKVSYGLYKVPSDDNSNIVAMPVVEKVEKSANTIKDITTSIENSDNVPVVDKNYVAFGNFSDIENIIKSNKFFPTFISGHSGNGKTMSIEQACAKNKRQFICISMTPETDESDLLGNYVLIDGNMEWRDGPVTTAARLGAVLCIDEIDYGAQNLSSLQRVFEGKPFLLKKKGEMITPKQGFTVFATANTKGKGSDDGRYMFTNVLNEAFLERFVTTMEQDWAPAKTEIKIVNKLLNSLGIEDDTFASNLVVWANAIRQTFNDGGCDEVISTRRLVHIVNTYDIFRDKVKAITFCLNRFDDDTKASFIDLYSKVDAGVDLDKQEDEEVVEESPFNKSDELR